MGRGPARRGARVTGLRPPDRVPLSSSPPRCALDCERQRPWTDPSQVAKAALEVATYRHGHRGSRSTPEEGFGDLSGDGAAIDLEELIAREEARPVGRAFIEKVFDLGDGASRGADDLQHHTDATGQCALRCKAKGSEANVSFGLDTRSDLGGPEAGFPHVDPRHSRPQQSRLEGIPAPWARLRFPGVEEAPLAHGEVNPILKRGAGVGANDLRRHPDRDRSRACERAVVREDGQLVQLSRPSHVRSRGRSSGFNAGTARVAVSQTVSTSRPKYSWTAMLRMPFILRHGTSVA